MFLIFGNIRRGIFGAQKITFPIFLGELISPFVSIAPLHQKVFHKRIYLHDDVWRVHCGQIPHRRFCTAMTSEGERVCRVARMPGGYTVTFSCRVVGKAALDQKFEWAPDVPKFNRPSSKWHQFRDAYNIARREFFTEVANKIRGGVMVVDLDGRIEVIAPSKLTRAARRLQRSRFDRYPESPKVGYPHLHFLAYYSYSLQGRDFDVLGHPLLFDFCRGMMASPHTEKSLRESPRLRAEFPPKELRGLNEVGRWRPLPNRASKLIEVSA